ncbi:MAG: hypothetical protein E7294_04845 [Lachnospiraceae bacterium]|jgi:hypothetical protein|nr:hypothetical protein [Lachnospiraceae bacterium]
MPITGETRHRIGFSITITLFAGIMRYYFWKRQLPVCYHAICSLIYQAVYFEWLLSIRKRFWQKRMRGALTTAAIMMIFWQILRTVKYAFVIGDALVDRYIWYCYYIPLILIPFAMFMASLTIGNSEEQDISKGWYILGVPIVFALAGILSNDLHQQAFWFYRGIDFWEEDYSYGIFWYFAIFIIVLSIIGILIMVFRTCIKRRFVRYVYRPVAVLILGLLYWINYAPFRHLSKTVIQRMYELPEMTCLILIAFWESLVFSHLIPSNQNDIELFRLCSIRGGLADSGFHVELAAAKEIEPTPKQLRRAFAKKRVSMNYGNALLQCQPVTGGYFYWIEDLTEINRLNRELEDTGDYLSEEHMMLNEKIKLEEKREHLAQQNRLYDMVAKSLKHKLDKLELLLQDLPKEEAEFQKQMEKAAILQAYVKRHSNLLLLGDNSPSIDSGELALSIGESLDYAALLGIVGGVQIDGGLSIPTNVLLFMYELFEEVLESAMPDVTAMYVTLRVEEQVIFYIEAVHPTRQFARKCEEEAEYLGGKIEVEYSEHTEYVTLSLPVEGGESG